MAEEPQGGQEPPQGQEPTEQKPSTSQQMPQGPMFDQEYVKGLRAEAAKSRKEAQEAKAKVTEFEDRDKTEAEKLIGKVESLTGDNQSLKGENLRLRVAAEKKLPAELVDRLKGSSRADIEADADELLKLVTQPEPQSFDGGAREPAPESRSVEQQHTDTLLRAFGRESQSR